MNKRIFVVDDEPVIADTLTAILKMNGYYASAFYDGETALSACDFELPDYILSDVMMGGMSGIDLAIRVKEQFPECRVLLFSGQSATFDLLAKAREEGHEFELLLKPVHPKDLLARLEPKSDERYAVSSCLSQGREDVFRSPGTQVGASPRSGDHG